MPETHEAARNITLAVTGASGSIYAAEMLRALAADERVAHINFVASENSLRVFAEELSLSGRHELATKLLGAPCPKLRQHADSDHARDHEIDRHGRPVADRDRHPAWQTDRAPWGLSST